MPSVDSEKKLAVAGEFPTAEASLFDYYFDLEQGNWVPWKNKIPEYIHDSSKKFNEILGNFLSHYKFIFGN